MATDFLSKRSLTLDTFATKRFIESKMRKTRLVILPTKCLHQMGFLLLFLSCPVIGDWGRIRPESEDSHNAIQIDREGTCGLERDPPGGIQKFFNEDGYKQCRLSEELDTNTPITAISRSDERRVDFRRINQRRAVSTSERRIASDRRVFRTEARRTVRSRSVEPRRTLNRRNDVRTRSLSLGREEVENERSARNTRQRLAGNFRRESERFLQTRRVSERQTERREQQRRLSTERRDSLRTNRNVAERRERETARLSRSQERERLDMRRDINRRSIQEQSRTRENDMTRQERMQLERSERRLSPARREMHDTRRVDRADSRRSSDRISLERRMAETRSLESTGRKSEQRENIARLTRNENRRDTERNRRLVTIASKSPEWNVRERRSGLLTERDIRSKREARFVPKVEPEYKKAENEGIFEAVTKWMDVKSYDGFTTGDWTTNCVIGAVVYFFTTRQVKAV